MQCLNLIHEVVYVNVVSAASHARCVGLLIEFSFVKLVKYSVKGRFCLDLLEIIRLEDASDFIRCC